MVEDEGRVEDGGEERFGELGVLELLSKLGDDDVMEVVPRLRHLVIEPGVQSRCHRFTVNAVFTRTQHDTGGVHAQAAYVFMRGSCSCQLEKASEESWRGYRCTSSGRSSS